MCGVRIKYYQWSVKEIIQGADPIPNWNLAKNKLMKYLWRRAVALLKLAIFLTFGKIAGLKNGEREKRADEEEDFEFK